MTDRNPTNSTPQDPSARPFNVRAAEPDPWHPERLHLQVDHIPRTEELQWRERDGLYVAEMDGYVKRFYDDGTGWGYNGATYELPMEDDTRRSVVGPWSSNAEYVNLVYPELGGVVEASASIGAESFADGCRRFPVAITAARLAEIHAQFPELAERQRTAIAETERERAEFNAQNRARLLALGYTEKQLDEPEAER